MTPLDAARAVLRRAREKKELSAMQRSAAALPQMRRPLLLLGHELRRSGASMLLVQLANACARMGYDVTLLVSAESPAEEEAAALLEKSVRLFACHAGTPPCHALLQELAKRGCRACIANTVVTGQFAPDLARYGFRTTWLIHEMEGSCRILRAQEQMEQIRECAHAVVFPAQAVRESFLSLCGEGFACPVEVLPQGIYKRIPAQMQGRAAVRARLEKEHDVPARAVLLAGAGAVNFGKGLDLLALALGRLRAAGEDCHVLWLGRAEQSDPYFVWLERQLAASGLQRYWHWAGFIADDRAYSELLSASDVFVLPSREDSYPSVLLEAQRLAVPTIAFEHSGGGEELSRLQHGLAARAGDIDDLCGQIRALLIGGEELGGRIKARAAQLADSAGFEDYAKRIVQIALEE
ncbi:MAG: glycosyltransferase [Eubacteriales bacterium]|nr:glycosyltransferase [Eubacteriales bacterium]